MAEGSTNRFSTEQLGEVLRGSLELLPKSNTSTSVQILDSHARTCMDELETRVATAYREVLAEYVDEGRVSQRVLHKFEDHVQAEVERTLRDPTLNNESHDARKRHAVFAALREEHPNASKEMRITVESVYNIIVAQGVCPKSQFEPEDREVADALEEGDEAKCDKVQTLAKQVHEAFREMLFVVVAGITSLPASDVNNATQILMIQAEQLITEITDKGGTIHWGMCVYIVEKLYKMGVSRSDLFIAFAELSLTGKEPGVVTQQALVPVLSRASYTGIWLDAFISLCQSVQICGDLAHKVLQPEEAGNPFEQIKLTLTRKERATGGGNKGMKVEPTTFGSTKIVNAGENSMAAHWDRSTRMCFGRKYNKLPKEDGGHVHKWQIPHMLSKVIRAEHKLKEAGGSASVDQFNGLWFEVFCEFCHKIDLQVGIDSAKELFSLVQEDGFVNLEKCKTLPKLVYAQLGAWPGLIRDVLSRGFKVTLEDEFVKEAFADIDRQEKEHHRDAHVSGLVPFKTAVEGVCQRIQARGLWRQAAKFCADELRIPSTMEQIEDAFNLLDPETTGFIQPTDVVRLVQMLTIPRGLEFADMAETVHSMGVALPIPTLETLFNSIDVNQDLTLSGPEFWEMCYGIFREAIPDLIMRSVRLTPAQIVPDVLAATLVIIVFDFFVIMTTNSFELAGIWPPLVEVFLVLVMAGFVANKMVNQDFNSKAISALGTVLGFQEKRLRKILFDR